MADPSLLPAILATLRKRESGGNYTIRNPGASASGAYQFIDPTWRNLTHKYGIGVEYPSAYMAPPSIQDEVAKRQVSGLLSQGYGPAEVAKTWYTGNPQGLMSAKAVAANNGLTADQYAANFLRDLGKISGQPMDTSPAAMAPPGFTPNAAAPAASVPMASPAAAEPDLAALLNDKAQSPQMPLGLLQGALGGDQQPQEQQQKMAPMGSLASVQTAQPQPFKFSGVKLRKRRGLLA